MHRETLKIIQKKKFRLLVRWKATLRANPAFQVPPLARFPRPLVFRACDEVLRLMKLDAAGTPLDARRKCLADHLGDCPLSPDQFMEILLAGRDVMHEFLETDASFCARFSEDARSAARVRLERVIRHLIDREMPEFFRRHRKTVGADFAKQKAM